MRRTKGKCTYCGITGVKLGRDHVLPRSFYPDSLRGSQVQRITVPACTTCNGGWSDDEAHFRNVVLVAGPANDSVRELWQAKVVPSLDERDGRRRVLELLERTETVTVAGQERLKIYPASDERVLRIVKKIVRGLSRHHEIESIIGEARILADVLREPIPEDILSAGTFYDYEPEIFSYWLLRQQIEGELRTLWRLRFFKRLDFFAAVEPHPISF
ncbi:MAG: hypothetical protein WA602_06380 [Silvibacterium sp.]